jgi:hypothetical protein
MMAKDDPTSIENQRPWEQYQISRALWLRSVSGGGIGNSNQVRTGLGQVLEATVAPPRVGLLGLLRQGAHTGAEHRSHKNVQGLSMPGRPRSG